MQPQSNPPALEQFSAELMDDMWKQRCGLLYKAWVQVRYHRRRQRFFDMVDKGTKATTLLLGASLFGKHLETLNWVATGISALGLMALVFGYGDRKQLHKELAEQAAGLAASIEDMSVAKLTPDGIAQWAGQYARFCAKAPPPLKTLTLLCEHEQSCMDGHPGHVNRPWLWRRLLSQVKG
jgi:hypothetical protein